MTNLVDKIKCLISSGHIAKRCRRVGCSINLNDAPAPHVLINMDTGLVGASITKCDYIFVGGAKKCWIVPIELKRGSAKAIDAVEQLRAGARFAETICKGEQVSFVPVLGCGGIKSAQRQELRKKSNRIGFLGQLVEVEVIRCGGILTSVLK